VSDGTFRAFEPERTRTIGPVHVRFTLAEDGLPDICLVFENTFENFDPRADHERRWAIVRFRTCYLFRLHDDEFRLEPESPREFVGRPDPVYVARESPLKDQFIAGNIHPPGVGLYPLGIQGVGAEALLHYRLVLDHDGIFDVLALGAEVTEEAVSCPAHDTSRPCRQPHADDPCG
jgi:hypothetical protein